MDSFEEGFNKLTDKVGGLYLQLSLFVSILSFIFHFQSQYKLEYLRLEVRHQRDSFQNLNDHEKIFTVFSIARDLNKPPIRA